MNTLNLCSSRWQQWLRHKCYGDARERGFRGDYLDYLEALASLAMRPVWSGEPPSPHEFACDTMRPEGKPMEN